MDPILAVLLSWQFVLFGLSVAAVMYVLRIIVEYVATLCKADLTKSTLWNNLVLPILPIFLGIGAAYFLPAFPYPGFIANAQGTVIVGDRVMFGLVAGLFSTLMYRVIKSLLYQKIVAISQTLNTPATVPASPATPVAASEMPSRGQL